MDRSRSGSEITFFNLLVRPRLVFRAMVVQGKDQVAILWMVVAGIVWVVAWAQVVGLGRHYSTGRILSGSLLIGPLLGCAGQMLIALFGMWMGNLLGPRQAPQWQSHVEIPPFPLKNLVWKRVLGADRLRRMWSLPILKSILLAWSWFRAALRFSKGAATGGPVGYWMSVGLQNQVARLFLLPGIALWLAVNFAGMHGFGAAGESGGLRWPLFALIVAAWGAYLWWWTMALCIAFDLPVGRGLLASFSSAVLGLGSVTGLLQFLTGVHLI